MSEIQTRWQIQELPQEQAALLAGELGVSPLLARLLISAGHTDVASAKAFLGCKLDTLDDPFAITNLRAAVERIHQALKAGQSLFILGDYDVDGVTSTTLMVSALRRLGSNPGYIVPLRKGEGYGISEAALERAFESGKPDLFIALDCGTNAVNAVSKLKQEGVEVIIIDHHQAKDAGTADALLVNPHVNDPAEAPWHDLCTVGLVFKMVHGLMKYLREQGVPEGHAIDLKNELDLVAIGTIADLVPLVGENRVLARAGLKRLQHCQRPGLHALLEICGLEPGQPISPTDVSFRLSPRINASGRLADASLPIDMLLCSDYSDCREQAQELDSLNKARQEIERTIADEAARRAENDYADSPGLVLYDAEWHAGVVGIVAGKLMHELGKPCIVLGNDEGMAKGSGRSLPGVNLVEALQQCSELLESWGGHPMAAGVALKAENVAAFSEKFQAAICEQLKNYTPESILDISLWLEPSDIGVSLLEELDKLHPFGQGNREPLLGVGPLKLERTPEPFGKGHFRFWLPVPDSRPISGVAWRMADRMPDWQRELDLALKLSWNHWNGRSYPQVELVSWRYAG